MIRRPDTLLLAALTILILPQHAVAQEPDQEETVEITKIKPNDNQGSTYLKASFVKWDNITPEVKYHFSGVSIEIEKYFSKNHALLSGFAVGYRKDVIYKVESGQMLNFKVFRTFGPKEFQAKLGPGVEWGMPSFEFDRTQFDYSQKDKIIYQQVYLVRNSDFPTIGTSRDATLYPFIDLGLVTRVGPLLFEAGVRSNIMQFGFENYTIQNNIIDYSSRKSYKVIPFFFVNIGIKN